MHDMHQNGPSRVDMKPPDVHKDAKIYQIIDHDFYFDYLCLNCIFIFNLYMY